MKAQVNITFQDLINIIQSEIQTENLATRYTAKNLNTSWFIQELKDLINLVRNKYYRHLKVHPNNECIRNQFRFLQNETM